MLLGKKWLYKFLIPLLLLTVWVLTIFNFVDAKSLSFSNLEYNFSKNSFNHLQTSQLFKGQNLQATFISPDNYLGIVAVRFNTFNRINSDRIVFRLKEVGRPNWYVQNAYNVNQIQNNSFFPFGIPIISNAKGKTYTFQIQSLSGKNGNAIALSTDSPIFLTRHNYSGHIKTKLLKIIFVYEKLKNLLFKTNFLLVAIIAILPLALYLSFLFFVKKHLKKLKRIEHNSSVFIDEFFLLHKNKQFPALDGIRGLAIILVFMVHLGPLSATLIGSHATSQFAKALSIVWQNLITYFPLFGWQGGAMGVDIFFFLSGFLMFFTIIKSRPSALKFITKRFKRLLPAHIAVIFGGFAGLSIGVILLNIFFLVNFFPTLTNLNRVTWTLSYEFLFYFICAVWFILASKNSFIQSWKFFFLLTFFIYITPAFLYAPLAKINITYLDTNRFIAFFFGVGLAKMFLQEKSIFLKLEKYFVKLSIPSLGIMILLKYSFVLLFLEKYVDSLFATIYIYFIFDISLFILLGSLLVQGSHFLKYFFSSKILRIFGTISYSLYLIHYNWGLPMSMGIVNKIESVPVKQIAFIAVAFVGNFLIATFLFHFLEKPYFLNKKATKAS